MTVFEFQATKIERIAVSLSQFLASTCPDKLDWHPPIEGADTRTIYEMIGECVQTNLNCAAALRASETAPHTSRTDPPEMHFSSPEDAGQALIDSARELAAAVRAMHETDLDREFSHWSGDIRGEIYIEAPYRNMAYHAGQINYIQTLYGDREFHVPDNWRK